MDLVINEWFPEYCRAEASEEERELLDLFLTRFLSNRDRIFIRNPSRFLDKIKQYAKAYQAHRDIYTIAILTNFIKNIILNGERCQIIDEDCILEDVVTEKLQEGNYSSDTYLFEAASKTESKIIITTDDKLRRQMHNIADYKVINLKEFLQQY